MAAATWTDPVDRADGYVVGQTVWNQLLGDLGNEQFLYENSMVPVAASVAANTTTSTVAADILTLTPANSIGINDWALLKFEFRKQAIGAAAVAFGLKVNATVVLEAQASSASNMIRSSATNRAEAGFGAFLIPPRSTANFGFGIIVPSWVWFTTAGAIANSKETILAGGTGLVGMNNALPNAAITSVTIRAVNETSSNVAEVHNAALYVIRNQ